MRSREEAEDAVQSTFLRAHKALERGVVPEFEAAWLYKIAHNVCLTRRSVLARHGQTIPLYDRDDIEIAVAAPEGRDDELWGLPDALATLSPKVRQAILLREWQGLSYAEIAEAMGTTVSAVETLIFRARRDLAAALTAEKPKRRTARLLDLLAALFGPKLAFGAALLALGGAGAGTAFELQRQGTTRPPAPAAPTLAPVQIGAAIAVQPRHAARTRPVRQAAAPAHRPVVVRTKTPASPSALPAAPGPSAPAVTTSPASPPAPAPEAVSTVAATTAAALPPAPALPAVELPAVSVPTVSVPTVSVPTPPVDLGH
jgi:RNA polymerase sigma factor (sigma-70 family)